MKSIYVATDKDIFISPDSAIVSRGNPWFKPEDGSNWKGKVLIGTCITRLGMHISEKFAHRYYQNFIAAVHTYSSTANSSVRWSRDGALVTGPGLVDATTNEALILAINNNNVTLSPDDLRQKIDETIAYVSSYITLKTGDLVLFDVELAEHEIVEGFDFDLKINETLMLHFKTR